MRRLAQRLIWCLLGSLSLALATSCGVALWLDRRLADPRLPSQIGDQLSRLLGAQVQIDSIDFAWPGWIQCNTAKVRLHGEPDPRPPLAEIAALRLLVSPASLLTRHPRIAVVRLDRPKIALRLMPNGQLALPDSIGSAPIHRAVPPLSRDGPAPGLTSPPPFLANFDHFEITDGELSLSEADGSRSFAAAGLRVRGGLSLGRSGAFGHGHINAREIVLKNGVRIDHLDSTFASTNASVCLPDLRASVNGASLDASLHTSQRDGIQRFAFHGRIQDLTPRDLERFFILPGCFSFKHANGELEGSAELERPEDLLATGSLACRGAKLSANTLLRTAGMPTSFPDWNTIDLGQIRGNISISNSWVHLERLETADAEDGVAASGRLTFGPARQSSAQISATIPLGKGSVRCEYHHAGNTNVMPYAAQISVDRVSLPLLLRSFDIKFAHGDRTLHGHDYAAGIVSASLLTCGDFVTAGESTTGTVMIADGTVAGLRLLNDLGVTWDAPELRSVRFGRLSGSLASSNGTLRVESLGPRDRSAPARFETSFIAGPNDRLDAKFILELPIWEGRTNTKLTLRPGGQIGRMLNLSINAESINTALALKSFRADPRLLDGRASFRFSGESPAAAMQALRGEGSIAVRPAKIQGAKFLAVLGSLLAMPGLDNLNLDFLQSDFTVSEQALRFTEIQSGPKNRTHLNGSGTVRFNGAMDMRGRLMLNSGLPGMISKTIGVIALKPSEGIVAVPFTITGPIDNPRVRIDSVRTAGAVTSSAIDHIPLVNRIPLLFRKRKPEEQKDKGGR
ncbi:MAG TPA: AsmA-like C-terminal region-containing protein [Verrucomicrobiae bacterium]|nr:AsmA-like C-terminal region-containing protein [Verrucomicrobiae bacterium]